MLRPSTLAMILAGGRVDELSVLTCHRPKSAMPFGGFARVIDFPLTNLMHSDIEQIAILSQYRSYSLINHIGTGAAWDMIGRFRGISVLPPFKDYESSDWYRGSADAVYQNLDFVRYHNPGEVLILSGDHIYCMDYRELIRYHHAKDADLTMACVEVPRAEAHRFGVADIADEDATGGRVMAYEEKPAQPRSNWASLTVFCFRPQVLYQVLAANQADSSYEFGRNIIPMMMRRGDKVYGYKFRGYWGYSRTVEEYWRTSMDLLGPAPRIDMEAWGLRTNLLHRDIAGCQPLKVGGAARIANSLIYNGCHIEGRVENSILFPGVRVAAGAVVKDSILFFNNEVGPGASLGKVVSDVNTSYGAATCIGDCDADTRTGITVIGWNNCIPEGLRIGTGCAVYPRIQEGCWPQSGVVADGEVWR